MKKVTNKGSKRIKYEKAGGMGGGDIASKA